MDPAATLASPSFNDQIAHETRRFVETLAGLDAAGWRREVAACPGWDVRELAVHVAFVAENWGATVRQALGGNPAPPWADPAAERARRIGSKRALEDAALLADLRRATHDIQRLLAGITPQQYALPAWHRQGEQSIARYLVYWFWEIGIHGWDLRAAFEPGAGFDAETRDVYVDFLARALPRYLAPGEDPVLTATYWFSLTEPARTISVRLAHGTHEVVPGPEGTPDVTFHLTGTTWVLATLNRIDPLAATGDGRIQVEGDSALAGRFWQQLHHH